jgi:hypothetical protein
MTSGTRFGLRSSTGKQMQMVVMIQTDVADVLTRLEARSVLARGRLHEFPFCAV